jgi:hypothetical protein
VRDWSCEPALHARFDPEKRRTPRTSSPRFARSPRRACEASHDPTGHVSERVDLDQTPELALIYGRAPYLWPRDLGVRLEDVPAGGLTVAWSEFERHKLVYYGLLNAGVNGLTVIDGDRVYDAVRLCQVDPDGTDRCAPK